MFEDFCMYVYMQIMHWHRCLCPHVGVRLWAILLICTCVGVCICVDVYMCMNMIIHCVCMYFMTIYSAVRIPLVSICAK